MGFIFASYRVTFLMKTGLYTIERKFFCIWLFVKVGFLVRTSNKYKFIWNDAPPRHRAHRDKIVRLLLTHKNCRHLTTSVKYA